MRGDCFAKVVVSCLLCLLIVGCCIQIGCGIPLAKHEKIVRLSEPSPTEALLAAETRNGSITVTSADVTDCNVTATIIARAGSHADAEKLAEQTKIRLVRSGDKLTVKIDKPYPVCSQSITVNLDVTVPKQTSLDFQTRNGAISISSIEGDVHAKGRNGAVRICEIKGGIDVTARNGSVTVQKADGNMRIDTRNGKVSCEEISGDIKVSTRNGKSCVVYSRDAQPVCNISMTARNGDIKLTTPPNFSASVEVSTRNGAIHSNLPITVKGRIDKSLKGTIGNGEGKLYLKTRNGSIAIR